MKNFPLMTAFADGAFAIRQKDPEKLAKCLDQLGFKKGVRATRLSVLSKTLCLGLLDEAIIHETSDEILDVLAEHIARSLNVFKFAQQAAIMLRLGEHEKRLPRDLVSPAVLPVWYESKYELIATLSGEDFRQLVAFLSGDAVGVQELMESTCLPPKGSDDVYAATVEEMVKYIRKHKSFGGRMLASAMKECLLPVMFTAESDEYERLLTMFSDSKSPHKDLDEVGIGHA